MIHFGFTRAGLLLAPRPRRIGTHAREPLPLSLLFLFFSLSLPLSLSPSPSSCSLPPLTPSIARRPLISPGQVLSGTLSLSAAETVAGTKEAASCSNHGVCDTLTGICACDKGFEPSDGQGGAGLVRDCGYNNVAVLNVTQCHGWDNAKGVCSQAGDCQDAASGHVCHCYDTHQGFRCQERKCPVGRAWWDEASAPNIAHARFTQCSNRGVCDHSTGKCNCDPGFTGPACNRLACGSDCSGIGRCRTLQQLGQLRTVNGVKSPLVYGSDPSDASLWDFNMVQGCLCDTVYRMSACDGRDVGECVLFCVLRSA